MMEEKVLQEIRAVITPKGNTALWERGGQTARMDGYAQIIANSIGKPLIPIFIKSKGVMENGDHALFPVNEGFFIINVSYNISKYTIEVKTVYRIEDTVEPCPFTDYPSLNTEGFKCPLCGAEYLPYEEEYAPNLFWTSIHPAGFVSNKKILVETLHRYSEGKWDIEPPEYLQSAIEAAKSKAVCFHCRESHYMIHGFKNNQKGETKHG
jgi:hypothetical protein